MNAINIIVQQPAITPTIIPTIDGVGSPCGTFVVGEVADGCSLELVRKIDVLPDVATTTGDVGFELLVAILVP